MILTLQKLLQKSKRVTDSREAHALALDLVESMLRHYAVVAVASYRHGGERAARVTESLALITMDKILLMRRVKISQMMTVFCDSIYSFFRKPRKMQGAGAGCSFTVFVSVSKLTVTIF